MPANIMSAITATSTATAAIKAAEKRSAMLVSAARDTATVANSSVKLPNINDAWAKAGFDIGQADMVIGAGHNAQPVGAGRRGFDIGIGVCAGGADPAAIRRTLTANETVGFDAATALATGMSSVQLPPEITDPSAAYAYYATHGMGEAAMPEEQRVPVLQNMTADASMRDGVATAVSERQGFWGKVAEFFGF